MQNKLRAEAKSWVLYYEIMWLQMILFIGHWNVKRPLLNMLQLLSPTIASYFSSANEIWMVFDNANCHTLKLNIIIQLVKNWIPIITDRFPMFKSDQAYFDHFLSNNSF